MLDVLTGRNGTTRLSDDIVTGLTRFIGGTGGSAANRTGSVLVAARRLDASANTTTGCTGLNQRACLVKKVAELTAAVIRQQVQPMVWLLSHYLPRLAQIRLNAMVMVFISFPMVDQADRMM